MKCLVVEDAVFLREVYRYTLRNTDYEIIDETGDGLEALDKLKKLKPDVIILDLVLPSMNGLDILKELPQISPNTKALVISSLDEEETITKAKNLGAIIYLIKPFTKNQLLDSLKELSIDYKEAQNG